MKAVFLDYASLDKNEFRGNVSVQLRILHLEQY